ncbi:SPOR domain-containing protein [uncultured Desulfobacter sp.]|uniref:SPOR domain-containing protein n=1 Tax=uncultured Desulfobacter sp. TaxID=240139 RepID=UPI002AA8A707|nr:SPOR domain-containing protein [uncultured Desulfobacter sp.]
MIRIAQNISIRFWMTTLMVLPSGFLLFPRLTGWLSDMPASVFIVLMYLFFGLGLGVIMDIAGLWRIRGLVRDAQLLEQSGIASRAEKKFIRAVRIFDSAWISPLAARRAEAVLISCLARFYLASGSRRREIQSAAGVWLAQHPKDGSLARFWLERFQDQDIPGTFSQSILTALADSWYADPELCRILVDVFLDQGRMDFSARRLYQSFLDLTDGDKDASQEDQKRVQTIQGTMFVSLDKPGSEPEIGIAESGSDTLGDERLELTTFMSGDQDNDDRLDRLDDHAFKDGTARGRLEDRIYAGLSQVRERWWGRVRGIVIACIGIGLVFFVWGTVSHMFKTAEQPARQIKFVIPKPFTIQVAAYHKKGHADKYMTLLAQKGIQASMKVTDGGGKTWYLVRVSDFTDQKSAQTYGNRLKADHIIDDFFVTKN